MRSSGLPDLNLEFNLRDFNYNRFRSAFINSFETKNLSFSTEILNEKKVTHDRDWTIFKNHVVLRWLNHMLIFMRMTVNDGEVLIAIIGGGFTKYVIPENSHYSNRFGSGNNRYIKSRDILRCIGDVTSLYNKYLQVLARRGKQTRDIIPRDTDSLNNFTVCLMILLDKCIVGDLINGKCIEERHTRAIHTSGERIDSFYGMILRRIVDVLENRSLPRSF